ncbi:hypothetical protein KC349_g1263 [Hortaea werneckii]|nr:hypothetical protein KC349_g1263 [Hortaea werneckii]
MSNRYDPTSRGFDDVANRRLTPRTAKTSLPEPTSHERDMLRRRVEEMAAEIRQLKSDINLNNLGQGLLGAAAKTFRDNPDEDGRHKGTMMLEAVDEVYTAFAKAGTRNVAKAEESLLLDMSSNEVEAYINRRFHAQPSTEQTAATTGGSGSSVGAHHANTRGDGTIGNIIGGDGNRSGMQATSVMGGATTGGGNSFGPRPRTQSGVFVTPSPTRSETMAGSHTATPYDRPATPSPYSASIRGNRIPGAFPTDWSDSAQFGTAQRVPTPAFGPPGVAGRKKMNVRGTPSSSSGPAGNANEGIGGASQKTANENIGGVSRETANKETGIDDLEALRRQYGL